MYKFFYSFYGDIYGVIEDMGDSLYVELLETTETEEVEKEWLQEEINKGNIDISKKT